MDILAQLAALPPGTQALLEEHRFRESRFLPLKDTTELETRQAEISAVAGSRELVRGP